MTIQSVDDFYKLDPSVQRTEIESLIAELNRFRRQKYGLFWNDKLLADEAVVLQCRDKFPVIDAVCDDPKHPHFVTHTPPQADLSDATDKPQPTHLLIEGDNYHALSALRFTHPQAVDLIYIDPPYNTGNRDFRYNDNFIDRENGDRHSLWLSFMKRRLEIARDLLKDTGVIFISIDNNEVAQLKLLCDAVFGEQNFVQDLIWHNKYTVANDAKYFSKQHDYVLCYAKNITEIKINLLEKTPEAISRYKNSDNDKRGAWKATPLDARSGSAANIFEIEFDNGIKWKPTEGRFSVYSREKLLELYKDERLWFGKKETAKPSKKSFLTEVSSGMKCGSILGFDLFGHTHKANNQLSSVLGKGKFSSPKPIDLITKLIQLTEKPDTPSVILDFFAGSGTTMHAVLELNKTDGGRRQCILVTNNEVTDKTRHELQKKGMTEAEIDEQGICRAVTYPRVQRVIEGYTNPKGDKVAGTGGKMRYYRLDFVERGDNHPDSLKLRIREKCTEMLCLRENVFTLLADSDAIQFNGKGWEVYQDDNGRGKQLAILSEDTPQHIPLLLETLTQTNADERVLYVFSYNNRVNEADFEAFKSLGFRVETMPAGIADLYAALYKNINQSRRD